MVGSLKPSLAVKLLVKRAWHTGQSASLMPGFPVFFHSSAPDHSCKFIFAVSLLVNRPPPPNVAPTSWTIIFDCLHVVVNGCVLWSTFAPLHTSRCCGGLLSLCWMNAPNNLRPSFSAIGRPLYSSSSFQLHPSSLFPCSYILCPGYFLTMVAAS